MRKLLTAAMIGLAMAAGCASMNDQPAPPDPAPEHPSVRVSGVDGTVFNGELLNGSITIDSAQGPLVLLTDHINSIDFSPEADTVNSNSVKVSGKIKEPLFELKSEHGVFTLVKDRLKRIDFVKAIAAPGDANTPAMASTTTKPRQALVIP